jgi:hypothetical protein
MPCSERGDGYVPVRIVPQAKSGNGQAITFVLAIDTLRQMCRLETTFETQNQALGYLRKHRREFERIARGKLARGEISDDIRLGML